MGLTCQSPRTVEVHHGDFPAVPRCRVERERSTPQHVIALMNAQSDQGAVVSEAFALLLPHAHNGALITLRIHQRDDVIHLTMTTNTSSGQPALEESLSWKVLTTLAQSTQTSIEPANDFFELSVAIQHRVQIPA